MSLNLHIKQQKRKVNFFMLFFLWALSCPMAAANEKNRKTTSYEQSLIKAMEKESLIIIKNLVQSPSSSVSIRLSMLKVPDKKVPYQIGGFTTVSSIKNIIESMPHVKNLFFTIYLDANVENKVLDAIASIIVKRFAVPRKFQKNISFKKFQLKPEDNSLEEKKNLETIQKKLSASEAEIIRREDDNISLRTRIEGLRIAKANLEKERDNLQADLNSTDSNLKRVKSDIDGINNKLAEAKKKIESLKSGEKAPFWVGYELSLAGYLIIILAGTLMALFMKQGMRIIGGGLNAISDVLKSFSSSSSEKEEKLDSIEEDDSPDQKSTPFEDSLAPLPSIAIKENLELLKKEISSRLEKSHSPIFVNYLINQLSKKETAYKAILGLEIIGKELAEGIFHKLPMNHRIMINKEVQSPQFKGPKLPLMLKVAEEINTTCFSESYHKVVLDLDAEIEVAFSQLDKNQQLAFLFQSQEENWPRIILYMSQDAISYGIEKFRETDKMKPLTKAIASAPQKRHDKNQDKTIFSALKDYSKELSFSDVEMFHGFYEELLDSLPESVAESFVREAKSENKDLEAFLNKVYVSFSDIFHSKKEHIIGILGQLNTREIALLHGLGDDSFKDIVKNSLSERRKLLLEEELKLLLEEDESSIKKAHAPMKAKVIKIMKELKNTQTQKEETKMGDEVAS